DYYCSSYAGSAALVF
nr:immunoglobulin light chain junction region [Macaca mulatta]MOW03738.1 immunoglobulin light chain junction region [Macaca mulatta]